MPQVKQIDIRSIFKKASGHTLQDPKVYITVGFTKSTPDSKKV